MGRPRKNDTDKRVYRISFRLTESEHTRLTDYAKSSGMSPANLMRYKVFIGKFPPAKMSLIDMEACKELKRIGVNLNQAVHKLNQNGEMEFYKRISIDLLIKINTIIKTFAHDGQPGKG